MAMVLCKCSVDGDQNMYQIPTDIVVSCVCPFESLCGGDGTGFVVIKINWWWLSCSCVHSEKWFKLQFCFENICPRLSCLGAATGSGDTQNVAQIWEIGNISAASRRAGLRLPEQRLGKLAAMIRSHPATHITSPSQSHTRHIWGDSGDIETGLIEVQRCYRTNRRVCWFILFGLSVIFSCSWN